MSYFVMVYGFIKTYGLLAVLISYILGAIGFPLPEETLLLITGFMSYHGFFDLWSLALVSYIAILLGDYLTYYVSKKGGQKILEKYKPKFIPEKRINQYYNYFRKNSLKALIIGRFVSGLRTLSIVFAGITNMSNIRFILIDGISNIVWVGISLSIGYLLGKNLNYLLKIANDIKFVSFIVVIFLLAVISLEYKRKKINKKSDFAHKYVIAIFSVLFIWLIFNHFYPIQYHDLNMRNINNIHSMENNDCFAVINKNENGYLALVNTLKNIKDNNSVKFIIFHKNNLEKGNIEYYKNFLRIMNSFEKPYILSKGPKESSKGGSEIYDEVFGKKDFYFILGDKTQKDGFLFFGYDSGILDNHKTLFNINDSFNNLFIFVGNYIEDIQINAKGNSNDTQIIIETTNNDGINISYYISINGYKHMYLFLGNKDAIRNKNIPDLDKKGLENIKFVNLKYLNSRMYLYDLLFDRTPNYGYIELCNKNGKYDIKYMGNITIAKSLFNSVFAVFINYGNLFIFLFSYLLLYKIYNEEEKRIKKAGNKNEKKGD